MYLSSLSELTKLESTIAHLIVAVIMNKPVSCFMDFSFTELFDHVSAIHIPTQAKNKKNAIRNVVYSLHGHQLIEQIGRGRYRIIADGLLHLQVQLERAYQEMEMCQDMRC